MDRVETHSFIELDKSFIDVLYLTNREQMPPEIKQLLKQKKLTYRVLSLKNFSEASARLDLIGTVIIEAKDTNCSQQVIQIIDGIYK